MKKTRQLREDTEMSSRTNQSEILNTGAIASCGQEDGPFIATGDKLNKIFKMPTGHTTQAKEVKLLQHQVRDPTRKIDIVPGIKTDSLISMVKFANADYMAVFDKEKVEIFDANNTKVEVTNGAILRGWRCKHTRLWQIPLAEKMANDNTDMVLSMELPTKWLQG